MSLSSFIHTKTIIFYCKSLRKIFKKNESSDLDWKGKCEKVKANSEVEMEKYHNKSPYPSCQLFDGGPMELSRSNTENHILHSYYICHVKTNVYAATILY